MRRPTNRRSIALVAIAVAAALLLLGLALAMLTRNRVPCPTGSATVVLDPGHGGEDPGAINEAAGLVEKELTLEIARETARLLRDRGLSVALTRDDDRTITANSPRGEVANACGAAVYVSVHVNAVDRPEPNYVLTLWAIEAKDRAFAETMQAAMAAELRPGTDLGDSGLDRLENGGLLTAKMPAVLVEPVFLSNPAEAARLANPDGRRREQIARAIADGIMDWVRGTDATPAATPTYSARSPVRPPSSERRSTSPWLQSRQTRRGRNVCVLGRTEAHHVVLLVGMAAAPQLLY
ncbi:MAG TPA: N-acetylmuramoyl-L-alanine amidase [Thermomicrobiales bacterium]|nr:N-acetylmuramoyl-L-alanine amidase [Thermomicrobiales bacterium]